MMTIPDTGRLYDRLFHSDCSGELHHTVRQLHDLYSSLCGVSAGHPDGGDILLPSGKAISVAGAAHCLLETLRTCRFLRGIVRAIHRLRKDFPGERIRVLYAGSGPYATLVTPLTSIFSESQVGFDILDINEESLNSVKKLYSRLGLLSYVNGFTRADASTFKIPENSIPHLIISETMNAALKNEPQVRIMMNLIPQMHAKGIFIPQKIDVNACLLSPGEELAGMIAGGKPARRILLGNIFSISRENPDKHEAVTISLPVLATHKQLSLLTEITVFEDQKLSINECSLTLPQQVRLPGDLSGTSIRFSYIMGENPRFDYLPV